jgi:hypothetical protein
MNIDIVLPFKVNLSRRDFLFKVFNCGTTGSLQVVGVIGFDYPVAFQLFCHHMRGQPFRIADRHRCAPVFFPLQFVALQFLFDCLSMPILPAMTTVSDVITSTPFVATFLPWHPMKSLN